MVPSAWKVTSDSSGGRPTSAGNVTVSTQLPTALLADEPWAAAGLVVPNMTSEEVKTVARIIRNMLSSLADIDRPKVGSGGCASRRRLSGIRHPLLQCADGGAF